MRFYFTKSGDARFLPNKFEAREENAAQERSEFEEYFHLSRGHEDEICTYRRDGDSVLSVHREGRSFLNERDLERHLLPAQLARK